MEMSVLNLVSKKLAIELTRIVAIEDIPVGTMLYKGKPLFSCLGEAPSATDLTRLPLQEVQDMYELLEDLYPRTEDELDTFFKLSGMNTIGTGTHINIFNYVYAKIDCNTSRGATATRYTR